MSVDAIVIGAFVIALLLLAIGAGLFWWRRPHGRPVIPDGAGTVVIFTDPTGALQSVRRMQALPGPRLTRGHGRITAHYALYDTTPDGWRFYRQQETDA